MKRISRDERARLRRVGFQKGHTGGWPLRGPSLAGRSRRRYGFKVLPLDESPTLAHPAPR